jgi:hypothetical protein
MYAALRSILLLALPVTVFGQVAELSFGGGENIIGGGDIGSGYSLTGGYRIQFATTLNPWRFMGYEFGYAYNRMQLHYTDPVSGEKTDVGGMAGHQGFFRFLGYAVPEGKRIRPFASGGVHFTNFVPPGSSVTSGGGNTKFGVNYGVGIKFIILPNWLIRLDARQYLTGKPFGLEGASGYLRQNEYSISLAFAL